METLIDSHNPVYPKDMPDLLIESISSLVRYSKNI